MLVIGDPGRDLDVQGREAEHEADAEQEHGRAGRRGRSPGRVEAQDERVAEGRGDGADREQARHAEPVDERADARRARGDEQPAGRNASAVSTGDQPLSACRYRVMMNWKPT